MPELLTSHYAIPWRRDFGEWRYVGVLELHPLRPSDPGRSRHTGRRHQAKGFVDECVEMR